MLERRGHIPKENLHIGMKVELKLPELNVVNRWAILVLLYDQPSSGIDSLARPCMHAVNEVYRLSAIMTYIHVLSLLFLLYYRLIIIIKE